MFTFLILRLYIKLFFILKYHMFNTTLVSTSYGGLDPEMYSILTQDDVDRL